MSIERLKHIIEESNSIVFFGGAGVSTESGIPDFRSATGLYNTRKNANRTPEYMLSHECIEREPVEFFDFYQNNILFPNAEPNKAHLALAKLERLGKLKAVITQNIDGLHQAAGSKRVIELHGSTLRNYCVDCGQTYALEKMLKEPGIPHCDKCGGTVRPDVVLYGEGLDGHTIDAAIHALATAEVLIVGGTSLVVYPAAGMIRYFQGKELVLINESRTPYDRNATLCINERIGEVLDEATRHL